MVPLNKGPFPRQPGQVLGGSEGLGGEPGRPTGGGCGELQARAQSLRMSSTSFENPSSRGPGKSNPNPRHTHKFFF